MINTSQKQAGWKQTLTMTGFVLLVTLMVTSTATASSVTGTSGYSASLYTNPFDPNGDGTIAPAETTITTGPIGGGTASTAGAFDLANIVNRHDARDSSIPAAGRITGTASSGFIEYTAATPFAAGTVISAQSVLAGFDSSVSYSVLLGGTNFQTGAGIPGTHTINVTTLPQVSTVSVARLELSMSTYGGTPGTRYADFNELVVLPETLERISVTNVFASSTTFSTPNGGGIYDLSGVDAAQNGGWAVGSSRVDLQACKLEYSIVSPK